MLVIHHHPFLSFLIVIYLSHVGLIHRNLITPALKNPRVKILHYFICLCFCSKIASSVRFTLGMSIASPTKIFEGRSFQLFSLIFKNLGIKI